MEQMDEVKLDENIREKVYIGLSCITDYTNIEDNSSLRFDLRLTDNHIKALKPIFNEILKALKSEIIEEIESDEIITEKECEDLKYVSDCLKLVKSKIWNE